MPEKSESDITRIARLSGLKPEQVRFSLKGYCVPKGNQLQVTISDKEALKILSERRNKIVWFDSREIEPENKNLVLVKDINGFRLSISIEQSEINGEINTDYHWAYITPKMLPLMKGESE